MVNLCLVVTSVNLPENIENGIVERIVENLINLRHPFFARVIGIVSPSSLMELTIVRMHFGRISLSDVVSHSPE
jgi:hypothetical protein